MSTRARTVLVVHPGTEPSCSDRMLLESVTGLREARCRVVVALAADGPLVVKLRHTGAEVQIVPMFVLRTPRMRPRGWSALLRSALTGLISAWRTLSRVRPDTVYVSTALIPQWPVIARLRRIRAISHIHEAERSGSRMLSRIHYLPHLASQRMLIDSVSSLETIAWALPSLARRSELVHNGVPSPSHPTPPREPLEGSLRILYIGPLSPRSGADLAIEAADLLLQEGRDAKVTLLGAAVEEDQWFEEQLHDQAADSEVEVEFAGLRHKVWPFLAEADVLLVPSRLDEPFDNIPVEGILALRPVVASDTSGLGEVAGGYRTTRLVRPDDASEITRVLAELAENWSAVIEHLPASRAEALRRHAPEVYRETIARACGAEPPPRPEGLGHAS